MPGLKMSIPEPNMVIFIIFFPFFVGKLLLFPTVVDIMMIFLVW